MTRRDMALGVGILAAACAGAQPQASQSAPQLLPDSVYVEVINENYYDARIHAVYGDGQRHTLGTVHGNGGQRETVLPWEPRHLVFEIQFLISGGQSYVSAPIDVVRGDIVEVTLPANIHGSGFFQRVSRN